MLSYSFFCLPNLPFNLSECSDVWWIYTPVWLDRNFGKLTQIFRNKYSFIYGIYSRVLWRPIDHLLLLHSLFRFIQMISPLLLLASKAVNGPLRSFTVTLLVLLYWFIMNALVGDCETSRMFVDSSTRPPLLSSAHNAMLHTVRETHHRHPSTHIIASLSR